MATDFSIHKNITLLHFSMLKQRLLYEETRESIKEASRLSELCEKYLFERYLDIVEDIVDVPVNEFEAELVEMIVKDFKSIDDNIACYGYNVAYLILDEIDRWGLSDVILEYCLNSLIFENKIPQSDPQYNKMVKYFFDHVTVTQKKYLEGITYYQLLNEKVEWGLDFPHKNEPFPQL